MAKKDETEQVKRQRQMEAKAQKTSDIAKQKAKAPTKKQKRSHETSHEYH